ncbi:unnamed protein product, partial [Coregonus sp. 'balchen']
MDDPLAAFPIFKKYDRNGLNLQIECKRVSTFNPISVEWAYELTRTNMQTLYEQSEWGWKEREKRDEMNDERAWYLLARDTDSYEVQLESRVRRKGLGNTQMKKVMLTVFKHNHGAYQFFREALQFEIDDTSPSMSGCCGDDCTYEILSRRTKHAEASGHNHGGGGHSFLTVPRLRLSNPNVCTIMDRAVYWPSILNGRLRWMLGQSPTNKYTEPVISFSLSSTVFKMQLDGRKTQCCYVKIPWLLPNNPFSSLHGNQ